MICAICDRRIDVCIFSPLYPLLRFLDCSVFLYSFWKVVFRRNRSEVGLPLNGTNRKVEL